MFLPTLMIPQFQLKLACKSPQHWDSKYVAGYTIILLNSSYSISQNFFSFMQIVKLFINVGTTLLCTSLNVLQIVISEELISLNVTLHYTCNCSSVLNLHHSMYCFQQGIFHFVVKYCNAQSTELAERITCAATVWLKPFTLPLASKCI